MRDYLQVLLSPNKHCESTDMLRRQVKPLRVYTVYCLLHRDQGCFAYALITRFTENRVASLTHWWAVRCTRIGVT